MKIPYRIKKPLPEINPIGAREERKEAKKARKKISFIPWIRNFKEIIL